MRLLCITALIFNLNDSAKVNNCSYFIVKMAESTKQYKIKREGADKIGKCVHSWFISGSPNEKDIREPVKYSESYDIQPYCTYTEDDFNVYESFSFDPKTCKLYLSENIGDGSIGEYKIKFIKQIKYKKKWLRKFLKCQRRVMFQKS